MLTKFISVSKTCFQNTKTALKNPQASIQGLETLIGQLAKLISERPEGSLLSNTESNPREQLNAITTQDKEGLVEPASKSSTDHVVKPFVQETVSKNAYEPCSNNNKRPIHEEQRLQIEELDEWRTHRLRTHDKLKPRHDELNDAPNQVKVGDKVLLDAADPRIATSEPNEEIPLIVLNIFPYGTVEVIHPKFDTFKICQHFHISSPPPPRKPSDDDDV
ncbi:hypothetical protein GOBAR_AA07026 [Gossypium barbadense]|uniref:Uncharacterized protein n=1 Tax=Gossypium barbadense TaxID=3634 RepID=A0A2P5YD82_GOSBA|nr:hypothetical protein GOBAR_AA07026 [Gossypium barbadense]